MAPLQTDWLPALLTVVSGAMIGLGLTWASRRRAGAIVPAPRSIELRELLATRDVLLDRLREIDHSPSAETPERARERYAIELEAAVVLRAIAADARTGAKIAAAPGDVALRHRRVVNVAAGFAFAAVTGALLLLVSSAAGDRRPGEPATGQLGVPDGQTTSHVEVAALEERVKDNPDDLDARLHLAQAYLVQSNLMGTYQQSQFVLDRQPQHPVALTYGGVVRLAMGDADQALAMFERAITLDPGLIDAWAYKATALARTGRVDDATQVIRDAEQRFPDRRVPLETLLEQIRRNRRAEAATPPHRGDDRAERVSGVIDLDPSAEGHVRYPAVVFISARPEHVTAGPPSAVLRLEVLAFPVGFSLGPENSMGGARALPRKLRLEARVDPDGNATTREPEARRGAVDDVAIGSGGHRILVR